jgi:hypothetical protein
MAALGGALSMGSVTHTVNAAKRSEPSIQDQPDISKEAGLLVAQHGEEAAAMAARRADAFFLEGNADEGARWLAVFRKIALTLPGRTP